MLRRWCAGPTGRQGVKARSCLPHDPFRCMANAALIDGDQRLPLPQPQRVSHAALGRRLICIHERLFFARAIGSRWTYRLKSCMKRVLNWRQLCGSRSTLRIPTGRLVLLGWPSRDPRNEAGGRKGARMLGGEREGAYGLAFDKSFVADSMRTLQALISRRGESAHASDVLERRRQRSRADCPL